MADATRVVPIRLQLEGFEDVEAKLIRLRTLVNDLQYAASGVTISTPGKTTPGLLSTPRTTRPDPDAQRGDEGVFTEPGSTV